MKLFRTNSKIKIILIFGSILIFVFVSGFYIYDKTIGDDNRTFDFLTRFSNYYAKNFMSSSAPTPTKTTTSSISAIKAKDTLDPKTISSDYLVWQYVDNEIIFYKISKGEKTKLFSKPKNTFPTDIRLSSDNKTIIYSSNGNLKTYNIETGEEKLILSGEPMKEDNSNISTSKYYNRAQFSPDMKSILAAWNGYEWASLDYMKADGSNLFETNNIKVKNLNLAEYAWSSDSTKVVLTGGNDDFGGEQACIYVADTSDLANGKQILPKNSGLEYPNDYKDVYSPVWSPNNQRIAFSYRYSDISYSNSLKPDASLLRDIYTINPDGSEFNQITSNNSYSNNPIWYDNNTLFYGISEPSVEKDNGIYSINKDTKNNTQLISDKFFKYFAPMQFSIDKKYLVYNESTTDDPATPDKFKLTNATVIIELTTRKYYTIYDNLTNADNFVGFLD